MSTAKTRFCELLPDFFHTAAIVRRFSRCFRNISRHQSRKQPDAVFTRKVTWVTYFKRNELKKGNKNRPVKEKSHPFGSNFVTFSRLEDLLHTADVRRQRTLEVHTEVARRVAPERAADALVRERGSRLERIAQRCAAHEQPRKRGGEHIARAVKQPRMCRAHTRIHLPRAAVAGDVADHIRLRAHARHRHDAGTERAECPKQLRKIGVAVRARLIWQTRQQRRLRDVRRDEVSLRAERAEPARAGGETPRTSAHRSASNRCRCPP